jgi:lipoprotein-anchoring transpeptidase ErfK/SrfK
MSSRSNAFALLATLALAWSLLMPATATAAGPVADGFGLVDPTTGIWYLRDAGGDTTSFFYGNPGDRPFMGDWDCDGIDTPGLYRQSDGYVYLRNSNTQGIADIQFYFGNPGDVPLAGDFDGDGCDTVSLYRPSNQTVYVIDRLGSGDAGLGAADRSFVFGDPGEVPFVGDFDGNGVDDVAFQEPATGRVSVRLTQTTGPAEMTFWYGNPGDTLFAGDFDGDGADAAIAFRSWERTFYPQTGPDVTYGSLWMLPIAGRFGPLPGGDAAPSGGRTALEVGDTGPAVAALQHMLTEAGFFRGSIDAAYGPRVRDAVMAFHKVIGTTRSGSWEASDWKALTNLTLPSLPARSGEPNRIEVDLTRQVLYLFQGGEVTAIMPVSSGNGELFDTPSGLGRAVTPRGDYTFQRYIDGWRISYLGGLYRPWYFVGGYAIHGSTSVPAYPASHGCIRIPLWEADWLAGQAYVGMPVHIWG